MSVIDLSPLEHTATSPLIFTHPRISICRVDCRSTNIDDNSSSEVNTPLLPKDRKIKSRALLSLNKFKLGDQQPTQDAGDSEKVFTEEAYLHEFLALSVPSEPLSASSRQSEFGSSSCGEESPYLKLSRRKSPRKKREETLFCEFFYKRVEDFLDSERLEVIEPGEHRRSAFNNLKVSTVRIQTGNASDKGVGSVKSEFDSPGLTISPSIHTSSLFQRRSSSKDLSHDGGKSEKKPLATKSPFFSYHHKNKELKTVEQEIKKHIKEHEEEDKHLLCERTSFRQKTIKITSLNLKPKVSKVHEEYHCEPLSAMSTKSGIEIF
jgi:hypothetical protein